MRPTHKKSEDRTGPYHKDCDLDRLLADCGLSKADLAKRVGVHPNTVTNWISANAKRAGTQAKVPGAVIAYLTLLRSVKALADG